MNKSILSKRSWADWWWHLRKIIALPNWVINGAILKIINLLLPKRKSKVSWFVPYVWLMIVEVAEVIALHAQQQFCLIRTGSSGLAILLTLNWKHKHHPDQGACEKEWFFMAQRCFVLFWEMNGFQQLLDLVFLNALDSDIFKLWFGLLGSPRLKRNGHVFETRQWDMLKVF